MHRGLLIFLALFLSLALHSQNTISGDFRSAPLLNVISQLETEYQVVFSYTDDLPTEQKITAVFQKQKLSDALAILLKGTNIAFELVDERYIVLKLIDPKGISLCGQVISEDGTPLPFANVLALSSLRGTTTDENGRFQWQDNLATTDSIEISYIGFEAQRTTAAELKTCPNISLKVKSFSFSEVVIKEYITSGIEQSDELDHVVLHPSKIGVVPGLTEADVLQMVQILPGVQSVDESATGLHIRGGTPDQNLILWDNIPVYNSGHFFGMLSAFNPYIVEEVKVYRSGFDASYGGRVSGVIDISSVRAIPKTTEVNVGLNFTHADISVVAPLLKQKSALVFSARRAYTDIVQSPTYKRLSQRVFQKGKIEETQGAIDDEEDIDSQLNLNFSDLNAKWLWQPSDQDEIALSVFRFYDQLDFKVDNFDDEFSTTDKINLNHQGGSASWQRQWSEPFSTQLVGTYAKVENDIRLTLQEIDEETGADDLTGFTLESRQLNDIDDFTIRFDNDWRPSDRFQFKAGYQMTRLKVKRHAFWNEEGSEEIVNQNTFHTGHFTLISHLNQQFRINTGWRWTYSELYRIKHFTEPRLSIYYLPHRQWQFKISAGRYSQFINQTIQLNDLGLNQEVWIMSNEEEDIPITKNDHYSAGLLFHSGSFQLEVEGYYKRLLGLTTLSPVFIDNLRQDDESLGRGKAWGLDLLVKKRWHFYETWLSYSYSRVLYTFDIYNNETPFAAPHDRPHSLTSMHQFKVKNWNFSLSWKLASGKVFTEAIDILVDEEEAFPIYNFEETNNQRLPLFHRLDASILYRFTTKRGRLGGLFGISVLNLYNRNNILSREYLVFYEDEIEEFVLEQLDRPMLGFTPNLVLRLQWK